MTGQKRKLIRPAVIWFTGLSGSGKSTIADRVEKIWRGMVLGRAKIPKTFEVG
ncbi:MAG: adenylyl-sulfate kinase [Kiritimatiellae bacterium]|nr:adenylyl-sulfate kinase [Kiritimatiellia bacterium]MDD5522708.1 adenylyl-sulfate kinase [Kiritimatiellia bacterium]